MGRDHSIECPLCELSYGGLGSDDTDCPDCGRLALVREAEWLRTKSEVERLSAALEKYGRHVNRCIGEAVLRNGKPLHCHCGLDAALAGDGGG